jgi:hypothetical protein
MGALDDFVKLNYLRPLREGAESTLGNITTFRSKDVLQNFLSGLQTNEDGSARPSGATQLDMNSPDIIKNLMTKEMGTMGQLSQISGGKLNTPEIQGIQSISDRILKGAEGASMAKYREAQAKSLADTGDYYKYAGRGAAGQEFVQGMKEAFIGAPIDSDLKPFLSKYLADVNLQTQDVLTPMSKAVKEAHPDWSEDKIKEVAARNARIVTDEYQNKTTQKIQSQEKIRADEINQKHSDEIRKAVGNTDNDWNAIELKVLGDPTGMTLQGITSKYKTLEGYKRQWYADRYDRLAQMYPELGSRVNKFKNPHDLDFSGTKTIPPGGGVSSGVDRNAPDWIKNPKDAMSVLNPSSQAAAGGQIPTDLGSQKPSYMEELLKNYKMPAKKDATKQK